MPSVEYALNIIVLVAAIVHYLALLQEADGRSFFR